MTLASILNVHAIYSISAQADQSTENKATDIKSEGKLFSYMNLIWKYQILPTIYSKFGPYFYIYQTVPELMDELPSVSDQAILQDEWGNDGYYDEFTGK